MGNFMCFLYEKCSQRHGRGDEINIRPTSSGHRRIFSDLESDLCPKVSLPTDGASVQSMLY